MENKKRSFVVLTEHDFYPPQDKRTLRSYDNGGTKEYYNFLEDFYELCLEEGIIEE